MTIITEDMRFRERLCKFAKKHGVTKAAIRYQTNRQFVYRQLKRYDGTPESLRLKSTRPYSHPNQHTQEELTLIKTTSSSYKCDGLAEVYVQLKKRGYQRSYGSMCTQLRKLRINIKVKPLRTRYRRHTEVCGQYPGDKVQVDIKYVPNECIGFNSHGKRYYQITAIDEASRKRYLEIVDEKSITNTIQFVSRLEENLGFKINTIQTDNGSEFVITSPESSQESGFQKKLKDLRIKHRRTQPYSPWQNGKVERSHRTDNDRFYSRFRFKSEKDMKKRIRRYNNRYNNIHTKVLGFKSPNQIVEEYLKLN